MISEGDRTWLGRWNRVRLRENDFAVQVYLIATRFGKAFRMPGWQARTAVRRSPDQGLIRTPCPVGIGKICTPIDLANASWARFCSR